MPLSLETVLLYKANCFIKCLTPSKIWVTRFSEYEKLGDSKTAAGSERTSFRYSEKRFRERCPLPSDIWENISEENWGLVKHTLIHSTMLVGEASRQITSKDGNDRLSYLNLHRGLLIQRKSVSKGYVYMFIWIQSCYHYFLTYTWHTITHHPPSIFHLPYWANYLHLSLSRGLLLHKVASATLTLNTRSFPSSSLKQRQLCNK